MAEFFIDLMNKYFGEHFIQVIKQSEIPIEIIITIIFHPIEYAKVLIRIGYEPIAPQETTVFGEPVSILPNIFEYIKHIKQESGFFGCYNGLTARIIGGIAFTTIYTSQLSAKLVSRVGMDLPEMQDPPNIVNDEEAKPEDYFKLTRRGMIVHVISSIIAYPFSVVSIRIMASFVGKENHYSSIVTSIASVYRDDGIFGFFHGFIPRIIGDLTYIAITGVCAYYVNRYAVKSAKFRYYTVPVLSFITKSVPYPLLVVSTCMAVTGSSLKAGKPPIMPNYPSWITCWWHLYRNEQHHRGSGIVYRYYIAPIEAFK